MRCVPETAGRRRREAARWSDEAEAAAAAAKGRGRRRRAMVARDLEKTRSTEHGGRGNREAARSILPSGVAAWIRRGRQCACQVGPVTGRRGGPYVHCIQSIL